MPFKNVENKKENDEDVMHFKYVENKKENVEIKLKNYLKKAESFTQLHYENSIASKIDALITKLNKCAFSDNEDEDGDSCNKAFVALAAPSLVGKTQLSFILKHRSLYFALS